ncbi:response regulator [Roseovarius sp. S4756]|uniref:response regulator n=1 Tax=Roseovarius maritimus TaxID=3342637 RepID=UPI00372644FB
MPLTAKMESGMKILAVDDDPIILELLTEVLKVAGFTNLTLCESAHDALQAIEHARVPFDCLLLDIQMPKMDGVQLTSAVRRLPGYEVAPILMITAMTDRSYVDSAFAAGATDYITKPFEIGEVNARLNLIQDLVTERRQKTDRNPVEAVSKSTYTVKPEDLEARLTLSDIDGFIDYLALENYLLQVSRISLFGMQAFGVVIPDAKRMFRSSSLYEYHAAITDVAEGISDCLKPRRFFISHAGGGHFICVLIEGDSIDPTALEADLNDRLCAMDLHLCDGRPLLVTPVVGDPMTLQLKSGRSAVNTLVRALSLAEAAARTPRAAVATPSSTLTKLFGF